MLASGEAQSGGQMTFTQADTGDLHDVGEVVEEGKAEEILDLSAINRIAQN